jgi:tetratricopeptide (TPR) repeat protein
MKTPFVNTRIYFDDSTFSIDFYEDYKKKNYVERFLEGITSVTRSFETEGMGQIRLRPTIFYFTRCSKCGFSILTNRDDGYKMDCKNCDYKGVTHPIYGADFNSLLFEIHRALGRTIENLKGQILLLLIQPNDPRSIDSIIMLCQKADFEKLEGNSPAFLWLAMEGHRRGMLTLDKKFLQFRTVYDKDVLAYSNESPPVVDKLLREIRAIDPQVRSLSMNLNPQEKDLPNLMIQGRFDEAKDVLEREIQMKPADVANLILLSDILMANRRLIEAKEKAILAQNIDPTNSFVWHQLGKVQFELGNYRDAIKAYEQAIKIDPLDTPSMVKLIPCYRMIGRLDLAARFEDKIRILGDIV